MSSKLNNMEKEEVGRIINLSNKIADLMVKNKGVLTLEFHNNTQSKVKIKTRKVDTNFVDNIEAYIVTFTNDINQTTRYEIQELKDVH